SVIANGVASNPVPFGVFGAVPPPVITSALTATVIDNQPFSYLVTASNGADPASFTVTGLPAGLSAVGPLISGAPTAAGTSYVSIGASNAAGTGTATLVLTVYVPPVLTCALTASGTVGKFFNYTITASNSPTSFNATGLPPGLAYLFISNGPQGWIN